MAGYAPRKQRNVRSPLVRTRLGHAFVSPLPDLGISSTVLAALNESLERELG